jgi:hypothetical protein
MVSLWPIAAMRWRAARIANMLPDNPGTHGVHRKTSAAQSRIEQRVDEL